MKDITHTQMVSKLVKDGNHLLQKITPETIHLWHMATGISGEAGELLDAIKKVAIYNKPIDRENVIEELGDLEFYMEGLRYALNITRDDTIQYNMNKLAVRYEGFEYTDQAAQERKDKVK